MRYLLVCLCLMWGGVFAQDLAALAPADTLATLSLSSGEGRLETLDDAFAALPWARAGATLDALVRGLGERSSDPDLQELLEAYEMVLASYRDPLAAAEPLLELCPAYERVIEEGERYQAQYGKHVPADALLSVSMSPYSPLPSVTALLRVDERLAPLYDLMQDTLLGCARDEDWADIGELEQDGVPLYVLGDAGDFPVVAGSLDNLYFIGSNPDDIRGVVRKALGADEPSLADSALYAQSRERFGARDYSLGFSLDLAALAERLETFSGFLGNDPELAYLAERTGALLRTLGGVAGQLSAPPEGLLSEMLVATNPAGGDDALLELLLCDSCRVSAPLLAPEGAVGVSAHYLPWRELWAYAQDWLRGLEAATGQRLDVNAVLEDEFGLEFDPALFDWLGSEVQTYTLEPVSRDLRTLLYNPAQVSLVPVSSPEAARAGLEALGQTFGPLLGDLMNEIAVDPLSDNPFDMSMGGLGTGFAVSEDSYEGVAVTRLRAGFNLDLAYAFVGNYLVVGSPAEALEAVIDTYQGNRSLLSDPAFQTRRSRVPAAPSSFGYSDSSAHLRGLGEVLELASQPLAFAASAGLTALESDVLEDSYETDELFDLGYADIAGVEAAALNVPATVTQTLEESEADAYGLISDWYELVGVQAGDEVTVRLESLMIDSYLALVDAESETYLAENDDAGETLDSALSFVAEPGQRYWLEVTSYDGTETGEYTLTVEREAASETASAAPDVMDPATPAAQTHELPDFAALLELFDLLPQSLFLLAEHVGQSESYSVIDGSSIYSRSSTEVRW